MKKLIFIVILFSIAVYTSSAAVAKTADKTLKKSHEGLACIDCHSEENPQVSEKVSCESCHGTPADIAAVTEDKYKKYYNPHNSLHYGTNAMCENCHREHSPSKLECNNPYCHTEFNYMVP